MKKLSVILLALVFAAGAAFAQEETDISRNRSKYANDQFGDDEQYTVLQPYETVSVKPVCSDNTIKNVIVMIGDGMGLEQISCGWVLNGGHLNLDNFPVTGFSRTYATDRLITDSCAGGSALATGVKTKYYYMGVDPDGNPVPSLLHLAQEQGKKTGVAVTCRINDATSWPSRPSAGVICAAMARHTALPRWRASWVRKSTITVSRL